MYMKHWDHSSDALPAVAVPSDRRRQRGQTAYHAGLAAEDSVERHYVDRGLRPLARRWRGPGGEIDLILLDGDAVVFVEVKKAASFDQAALRVRPRQAQRIWASALAYLDHMPRGSLTDMRIDVALVDQVGAVQVLENAFADFW